jgi:hypothetical protein
MLRHLATMEDITKYKQAEEELTATDQAVESAL